MLIVLILNNNVENSHGGAKDQSFTSKSIGELHNLIVVVLYILNFLSQIMWYPSTG